MMNDKFYDEIIVSLKAKGIIFLEGLTDCEFSEIKNRFNITFPPDLKKFFQKAYPISSGFVPWREALHSKATFQELENLLTVPLEGILYDVRNNAFWYKGWGNKPADYKEQEKIIKAEFPNYPRLIPIYGHRYMPQIEKLNTPVYSVHQTDIIYYGYNLFDYLKNEFGVTLIGMDYPSDTMIDVPFWNYFLE